MLSSLVDVIINGIEIKNNNYINQALKGHTFIYSEKEVFVIVNSEIFTLNKDKLLFIDKHQKYIVESNENEYLIISCEGSIIHKMFSFGNISNKVQCLNIKNDTTNKKIQEIVYTYKSTLKIDLNIIGIFYQLLYSLESILLTKENSYSFYVIDAIEFIKSNFNKDITIVDVASYCGVHPNYLSKLFKDETGKSTKSYILKYRMKQAEKLLKTKAYSISQISKKVGFKNQLYFSKCFKKYFGKSPTNYISD